MKYIRAQTHIHSISHATTKTTATNEQHIHISKNVTSRDGKFFYDINPMKEL